ncbi:hypothetical protein GCM10010405_44040 [Streptomyces macrosporus]|uniref:Tc1-like transposase DDE domain-containing protein n=1 Tax=Streptomyces macrosporus TaxID=44032 RepID=A0ABN3KBT5_9ACTN
MNHQVRFGDRVSEVAQALRSIRAARPDGVPIHMVLDHLSAYLNRRIRRWADRNKAELCFTPTHASWADPIEAHFGPLRQFTLANSNHPNHTVRTRAPHAYLRRRNANARHPDVLAAQRRERARIRSEKHIRRRCVPWSGPVLRGARCARASGPGGESCGHRPSSSAGASARQSAVSGGQPQRARQAGRSAEVDLTGWSVPHH